MGLSVLVIAALGGIAWALSDSAKIGKWFAILFAAALLVLLALAAVALQALRFLLHYTRLHLPSWLRHGLANLYRPGNQSAAVLAALGLGVMLILAVYLMQGALLADIRETASPTLPNLFLIDIGAREVDGVKTFMQHQPGVTQQLDLLPVVLGRFVSFNGQRFDQMTDEKAKQQHFPRHYLESAELSWADTVPPGDKIRQGKWWSAPNVQEIAVSEGVADRIHVGIGSAVQLEIGGVVQNLKVTAIYRADGQHLGGRVWFVLPSGLLKDQRAIWYGGAHVDPRQVANIERGSLYRLSDNYRDQSGRCDGTH